MHLVIYPLDICELDFVYLKLTDKASFDKDLGLDSLDAVEVVLAVEEVHHYLPLRALNAQA